jgi:hypothetical protein
VWTAEEIARGLTGLRGYDCKDASFKDAIKAFGWPLDLGHVVTYFSEQYLPQRINNELFDDPSEWACFELHIPEQITFSSRRRLARLLGAKDWRIPREHAIPQTPPPRPIPDEPITEAEYADKKYRECVESARRFRQPVPTREQWDEERRLDREADEAFFAMFKRTPEEEAEEAAFIAEEERRDAERAAREAGAQAPRPRVSQVLAVAAQVIFALWIWNVTDRADGYATGQMWACQDYGRSNCDRYYWAAFRSAAKKKVKRDIEGFAIAGFFFALMLGVVVVLGRTSSTGPYYDGSYEP